LLIGCRQAAKTPAGIRPTPRDTTINIDNAFTPIQLDSLTVARYLDSAALSDTSQLLFTNFYNSRNFQYAWIDENGGLTEHAGMLWNLYRDYRAYAPHFGPPDSSLQVNLQQWTTDSSFRLTPAAAQAAELRLTRLFFDYAFSKYIGNVNPGELQWFIPRRKIDVTAMLDSLLSGIAANEDDWEPLHPQYRLLKQQLLTFMLLAENGGWDSLHLGNRAALQQGDHDSLIVRLKKRLQLTANFPATDSSRFFSRALRDSVRRVQEQFGLSPDGVVGPRLLAALNVPVEQRVQQILINMERARWLPRQPKGTWILANIPSFTLQVFEQDSAALRMNIVVGKAATKTVIFSDELQYIVFSPYWNVPPSIVKSELLPAMQKDDHYLARSRMEQTGTRNGLPVIRQLPGPGNALGNVKFLFPNNYNIYLHDTPAKFYFDQRVRAFSHGCVRIEKPFGLAKYLLRNDTAWTDRAIMAAMNSGREQWVTLPRTVPVFLTYFTCWVDSHHRIQFREDIYGHDERMAAHLFGH
jgi:murein L,D-transpeptidase YcbB/YkuD